MGIWSKLFGRAGSSPARGGEGEGEEPVRFYDGEGNEVVASKSVYREKILPGIYERAWDEPDALYGAVVMSLEDGLFEESLRAAERLRGIDPQRARSATVLAIALMKTGRLDEAQQVLEQCLAEEGESGVVLTNLAKVYAERGQEAEALETLWRALNADPNQSNALEWWGAIHHERGGEDEFYRAMEQAAQIEGSWRPQMWLARRLLEAKKIDSAMKIYEGVLRRAGDDGDALMMITGDLGNNGYVAQMLDLVAPSYRPERHGPAAGINLIQACLRMNEREKGLRLCDAVERLRRPDLKKYLTELRARLLKL